LELILHVLYIVRLSSGMEPIADTTKPARHETSYGIQNVRYIFQIMTDAIAIRQVEQV